MWAHARAGFLLRAGFSELIHLCLVLGVKYMLYSTYIPRGEIHLSLHPHTCAGDQGVEYPLALSPHLSARGAYRRQPPLPSPPSGGHAPPRPCRPCRGGTHAGHHLCPQGETNQESPSGDDQHLPGHGPAVPSAEGPLQGEARAVRGVSQCAV